jgi:large subunit ribosomal protein L23
MPDENFTQKINKKMYRAGMASIFSQLAREGRLAVVDSIKVDSPKTKALAAKFKAMNLESVLVIAEEVDENLYLASRNLMNVLVAPIVSEKATMVGEKSNAVTFKVLQDATKPEIKAAVELMFKVEVQGVSVLNTKGKTKRFGKSIGRRDNVRKAYVTLKAGQELNLVGEGA